MFEEKSDRSSFEQFRSNTCHKLKNLGDLPFITQLLESNQIRIYYERKWYPEALYLLAMLDHLSNLNGIPLCSSYSDLRKAKPTQHFYPSEVLLLCELLHSDSPKEDALRNAIPEFMQYNIIELDTKRKNGVCIYTSQNAKIPTVDQTVRRGKTVGISNAALME